MKLLLLLILGVTLDCGPKCIKYESKQVLHPAWVEIEYLDIDDIRIPIFTHEHPAHWEWEPVCVAYEVEKEH